MKRVSSLTSNLVFFIIADQKSSLLFSSVNGYNLVSSVYLRIKSWRMSSESAKSSGEFFHDYLWTLSIVSLKSSSNQIYLVTSSFFMSSVFSLTISSALSCTYSSNRFALKTCIRYLAIMKLALINVPKSINLVNAAAFLFLKKKL